MSKVIYCVEDDTNIRELVVYALKTAGFEAAGFINAGEFYEKIKAGYPDMIILDIMLPDIDGITILRKLRSNPESEMVPVIMLTAKTAEYDRVKGLDSGADDYVTKPFGVMELISRVKAVFRRTGNEEINPEIVQGDLRVDVKKHKVYVGKEQVLLTHKEFELLLYLLKNKGLVLSREKILDVIWDYGYEGETRTIDVHIGSLRQKLGICGDLIKTIRGVGYRIDE